jgi:hypothetical protein
MPDIVLNPVVDTIDAVPEPFRDNYEERDGKFVLSKPIKIEDVGGLKGALDGERKTLRELRDQLGKYKDLPSDVQDRLKKLEEVEQREAERKGEYQTLITKNAEKHQAEIKAREDRINTLQTTLTNSLRSNAVTLAINAAGGNVEGLLPHVLPKVVAVEDPNKPGEFTIAVVDPKDPTKERIGPKGQPMTIEDLVLETREHPVLSKLFEAKPTSGSGGSGTRFGIGQPRIVKLTAEEAKDPARYRQLKEQKAKGEIDGVMDANGRRII